MTEGDCNVCLIGGEGEYPCEVFNRKIIKKSRKEHRCYECKQMIPAGSSYEYTFTVFDGEGEAFSVCLVCVDIREAYYCRDGVNGPLIGMLWDDIYQEGFFREFTTGCLSKLKLPEAKALMVEKWQKWKGLKK